MADVSDYWNWLPAVNSGAAQRQVRQNFDLRERELTERADTERQRLMREAARDERMTAYQERLLAAQEAEAAYRQQQLQQRQAPVVPVEIKVGGRTFLYNPLTGVPTPVDGPPVQPPAVPGEIEIGGQKFIFNTKSGNFRPLSVPPTLQQATDPTGNAIQDIWMTPAGRPLNLRQRGGGLDFSGLFGGGEVSTRPQVAPPAVSVQPPAPAIAPPPSLLPQSQATVRKVYNPKTGRVE